MADNNKYFFGENNLNGYNRGIAEAIKIKLGSKVDTSSYDAFVASVNTALGQKANAVDVYSKSDIDDNFALISDVYTQAQIDSKLSQYAKITSGLATQSWVNQQLDPINTWISGFTTDTLPTLATQTWVYNQLESYVKENDLQGIIDDRIDAKLGDNYYVKSEIDDKFLTKFALAEGNELKARVTSLEELVSELSISSGSSSVGASLDLNNIWNWANVPVGNFEFHTGTDLQEDPKTTRYGRSFKTAQMYQKKSTKFSLTNYSIKITGTILINVEGETVSKVIEERERDFPGMSTTLFDFCNKTLKVFLDVPFNIGSDGLRYNSKSVMNVTDWNEFINTYFISGDEDEYKDLLITNSKYPTGNLVISISPFLMNDTETPYNYLHYLGEYTPVTIEEGGTTVKSTPSNPDVRDCYYFTDEKQIKVYGFVNNVGGWYGLGTPKPYGEFNYKGQTEQPSSVTEPSVGDCYFFYNIPASVDPQPRDVKIFVGDDTWVSLQDTSKPNANVSGQMKIQWKKRTNGDPNVLKLVMPVAPQSTDPEVLENENFKLQEELWEAMQYYKSVWESGQKADLIGRDADEFITLNLEQVGNIYELTYKDGSQTASGAGYRNEFEGKASFLKLIKKLITEYNINGAESSSGASTWVWTTVFFNDIERTKYTDFSTSDIREVNTLLNSLGWSDTENMDVTDINYDYLQSIKVRYQKDNIKGYTKKYQKQSDIFEPITSKSTVTSLGGMSGDILLDQDIEEPGNVRMWVDTDTETGKSILRGYVNPIDPVVVVRTGMIIMWPGNANSIPSGYLLCDGASYTQDQYPGVYSVIGNKFTDNPSQTNFNVPNMEDIMRGIHYIIKI